MRFLNALTRGSARDYAGVVAADAIVVLATFACYRVASERWAAAGLGAWVVARRAVALIQLPLCLGTPIGLPRFVSLQRAGGLEDRNPVTYLAAAVLGTGLATLIVGLVALLNQTWFSVAILGGAPLSYLVVPVVVGLVGLVLHSVCVAYYRGHRNYRMANLLQLLNLALIPLGVLVAAGSSAQAVFYGGLLSGLTSLAAIAWALAGGAARIRGLRVHASDLGRFGLPRVPGEMALAALQSIPPLLAARWGGLEAAGRTGVALAILGGIGSLVAPATAVILPRASELVASGGWAALRSRSFATIRVAGAGLLAAGALTWMLAPAIVAVIVGSDIDAAMVTSVRLVSLAVVPYGGYMVIRGFIDAVEPLPINAVNLLGALATLILVSWIVDIELRVEVGLVAGMAVLGALSATAWFRIISTKMTVRRKGHDDVAGTMAG